MLSAKINGEFVDMFPNTSIKYVFNSPAFSENVLVGDFSYAISFPLTDKNKKIFNYVNLSIIFEDITNYDIEIYENNIFILAGLFKIKNVENKISGNIINSAYDFSNQMKNITTKDLDLGGTIDYPEYQMEAYLNSVLNGEYPDFNFTYFPILNEILYDGSSLEDYWHDIHYINEYLPESSKRIFFPYLAFVIEQIFKKFNFILTTNCIANDNELKKLALINIYKENIYKLYSEKSYNLLEHIILCKIEKILSELKKTFCLSYFFKQKEKKVDMIFNKNLLTNLNYIDWTDKIVEYPGKTINEIYDGFNLHYDFDSSDETISEKQLENNTLDNYEILDPVLTPDDLPVFSIPQDHQNVLVNVICENTYYIFKNISDPEHTPEYQWVLFTWNFFSKITNAGEKEYSTKLSTLGLNYHEKKTGIYKRNWMVPHSDQKLYKDGEKKYINEIEPRILFYRGKQPMNTTDTVPDYPLGTSGRFNAKGEAIGNYTLNWDGDDGLYNNFWKEWLNFKNKATSFKFKINLNLNDVLNLDLKTKIKINSNFYLIKKLTINLPIKNAATVEMVRI